MVGLVPAEKSTRLDSTFVDFVEENEFGNHPRHGNAVVVVEVIMKLDSSSVWGVDVKSCELNEM